MSAREELRALFGAGLAAVDGARAVESALRDGASPLGEGPFALLAVGKAARSMAEGARRALGERVLRAELTVPEGTPGGEIARWLTREAAHPVPDARSQAAAEAALALARGLSPELPLLLLLSGGTSALWSLPAAPLSLEDKRRTHQLLLQSGVDIASLNCVRKHLSAVKGGGLLRAAGDRPLLTLALSDVAGDDPAAIGSGPSAADPTTFADALDVVRAAGLEEALPGRAMERLRAGARGEWPETLEIGDPLLARAHYRVVGSLVQAIEGVERRAREVGMRVHSLGASLYGEARGLASGLVRAAREACAQGADLVVAGGEPTVAVRGAGWGGRAQELALAFALELRGADPICALFAGTDGRDGPTPAAGAFAEADCVRRAERAGLDPRAALAANDSHPLLAAGHALFTPGPTGTNVGDLALIRTSFRRFPSLLHDPGPSG